METKRLPRKLKKRINKLDLFDFPKLIPFKVQEILDTFTFDDNSYETCDELVKSLESIGYTCDYGLDAIPYELKKL